MKSSISPDSLRQTLEVYKLRAQSLCGRTVDGKPLGAAVVAFLEGVIKNSGDPEFQKKRAEFLERAEKDPAVRQQLCAIRIETFQNYLLATPNFMNFFFEIVNLGLEDRPVAQNTTTQELDVYYVGPDGTPKEQHIERADDEVLIDMRFLTTDVVKYKKVDIYRGSIVDAALATIRLSDDWANQADGKAKALLLGSAFGSFVFSGKKCNYSYVTNSRVNKKNLPDTNDVAVKVDTDGNYDPDGSSYAGKFGFATLEAIVDYASRWAGAFQDGALVPTGRILVAPPHIKHISKGITPGGATSNPIADALLQQGWFGVHYLGKNWTFVPDNTLDPDDNVCYPEFNKKPGRVYLKPSLDVEKVVTNHELDAKNEEERYMMKPFGAYINSATKPFIARFTYDA